MCSQCGEKISSPANGANSTPPTLADLESGDFFSALGSVFRFDVNISELEQRHKDLMRLVHPDVSANEADAAASSAYLNTALDTLRKPGKRAMYMLELIGFPLEEGTENPAEVIAGEFLGKVMEIQEEIHEMDEPNSDSIARVDTQLGDMIDRNSEALRDAFQTIGARGKNENEKESEPYKNAVRSARAETAKLQYLQRIQDILQQKRVP